MWTIESNRLNCFNYLFSLFRFVGELKEFNVRFCETVLIRMVHTIFSLLCFLNVQQMPYHKVTLI